uniref:Uncharacterized protein n=1 Tax=Lepeophtheirus salmonis TaxID=72036 RepID=A0A0K2U1H3_LEPSM
MKVQRKRKSDLLDDHVKVAECLKIVGWWERIFFKVKKLKKDSLSLARSPGSGGLNKIWTPAFLDSVKEKIDWKPHKEHEKDVQFFKLKKKIIFEILYQKIIIFLFIGMIFLNFFPKNLIFEI